MPKERVQHGKLFVNDEKAEEVPDVNGSPSGLIAVKEYVPGEKLEPGQTIREEPSLDVTWNRDGGWVQVSIEAPTDWWDRFSESYNSTDQSHYGVYSESLTRQEINHMIKTLRRARDAAFGADE